MDGARPMWASMSWIGEVGGSKDTWFIRTCNMHLHARPLRCRPLVLITITCQRVIPHCVCCCPLRVGLDRRRSAGAGILWPCRRGRCWWVFGLFWPVGASLRLGSTPADNADIGFWCEPALAVVVMLLRLPDLCWR